MIRSDFVLGVLVVALISLMPARSYAGIPMVDSAEVLKQTSLDWHQKKPNALSKKNDRAAKKRCIKITDGENKTAAIVFAILIPFVGVAIYQDRITNDFWITLLLTALLYVPGLIYALSIVLKRTR